MSRTGTVTRVFVIHSDPAVRDAVREYIGEDPSVTLVGEAESSPATLEAVLGADPDVALVDVNSSADGIQLCRELLARKPDIRCLVLAGTQRDEPLLTALLVGAAGYVLAQESGDDVISAIRQVAEGRSLVEEQLVRRAASLDEAPEPPAGLSDQELSIAELVAEGLSNPEIASRLHLSRHTVRNYLSEILRKLGARNRVEVATFMTRLALMRRGVPRSPDV